jgi:MoaA/NifB/PqqE/SkfB family radical SAM enzyme
MKIPHDKFCVLPWVSLETSPIGTVRTCCLSESELTDNNGEKFNLNSANFSEIQQCDDMRQLRSSFLNAKQPVDCRKCWREERAGRTSKRMHTLNRLKHILDDSEWTEDAKPLMFLDLKLGNICNLKCRICGSWSSSAFATEEISATSNPEDSALPRKMLKDGAWPRNNPIFWKEIDKVIDDIRYIEFTGGEPFMIRQHFEMLQRLVDRGIAGNVEIHYNTNGTQCPSKAEEIWKHFKHVEIAFSIDDVGKRFEYQRMNAVWEDVCQNVERFRQLRDRNTNITLQVCCTVNVFNVYYLETVAQWIEKQGFDFIYWNMMHDAYYLSIATLPEKAKNAITVKLSEADISEENKREFTLIIDFMNKGVSLDGQQLRDAIWSLDERRNQSLNDIEPEFAELIDYGI